MITPNWNHHPDGSCGVVRVTDCEKQVEGYYTSHEGKWQISVYDNFTDKRGWSRLVYLANIESQEEAINKLKELTNVQGCKSQASSSP